MNKLIVISDTKAFSNETSIFAFGPVVREFENMKPLFTSIEWLVFDAEHNQNNFLKVDNNFIQLHFFTNIGGHSVLDKIKVILKIPSLFMLIWKLISKSNYIHLRAPSVPSLLALFFLPFYPKKIFWFKYAGSWVGEASFSYRLQRKLYKLAVVLFNNMKLTINGAFETHPRIFNFQNPCLTTEEYTKGIVITKEKIKEKSQKLNFCFVGNLNENKGISNLLEAFSLFYLNKSATLHVVGSSDSLEEFKNSYENQFQPSIKFYGQLPSKDVHNIYSESDFICLPSRSEGFPKVIGEAMNYGVVPIITDISSIGQLIKNGKNGFLLKSRDVEAIIEVFKKIDKLSVNEHRKLIKNNLRIISSFTYNHYNRRVKQSIFELD